MLSITIPCEGSDIGTTMALSSFKMMETLEAIQADFEDPETPVPSNCAEQYLWLKEHIGIMRDIRLRAEDCARAAYMRVIGSPEALKAYDEMKGSAPAQ